MTLQLYKTPIYFTRTSHNGKYGQKRGSKKERNGVVLTDILQVIIIGGGPAGLATALRLQQTANISCRIYELRTEPTTLGGAVGIPSNGLRLMSRLGVNDALCARGNGRSEMTVRAAQGSILGRRDMAGPAREKPGYLRIKRTELIDVLLGAAKEAGISVSYDKRIVQIHEGENKVTATFSDGTTDTADILLGCDGIHSSVRKLYVDPLQEPEYSGVASSFAIIPASSLSASTTALMKGMSATITQEGMFLSMPCTAAADEIMWGFSQEVALPSSGDMRDGWEVHAREEVKGFKSKLLDLLQDTRGEWGTAMKEIVNATPTVKFFPVYRLPLGGTWYRGRCLLVGDAAHAMQPHAGQGVSMATEDAFLLAKLLQDEGRTPEDVFRGFDKIRRPRVTEMYNIASRNVDLRQRSSPLGLAAKQLAIRVYLWASGVFGLGMGSRVGDVMYDVEENEV